MSFAFGDIVDLPFDTWTDEAETVPVDPDAIVGTITAPDGTTTANWPPAGDFTRSALGKFVLAAPATVAGFWTAHIEATGASTTARDYAWEVRPAGGTFPWRPDLATVATYISERTVTVTAPGVEEPVGTFTNDTTPTADQAATLVDAACRHVATKVGTVNVALYEQARDAAAMRAAGLIELSYPVRDADLNVGDRWLKQAADAVADLKLSNSNAGATGDPAALLPVYSFPDPPVYGDTPL